MPVFVTTIAWQSADIAALISAGGATGDSYPPLVPMLYNGSMPDLGSYWTGKAPAIKKAGINFTPGIATKFGSQYDASALKGSNTGGGLWIWGLGKDTKNVSDVNNLITKFASTSGPSPGPKPGTPTPAGTTPTPAGTTPTPAGTTPTPAGTTPTPAGTTPTPAGTTPTPAGTTPTPAGTTPTPAGTTPTPAGTTPTPAGTTPTPGGTPSGTCKSIDPGVPSIWCVDNCGVGNCPKNYCDCSDGPGPGTTPTPAGTTPTPAGTTPTPAGTTPTPAGTTPTPAGTTPTPASKTPTPASKTPTPASKTPTPKPGPTPKPPPPPKGGKINGMWYGVDACHKPGLGCVLNSSFNTSIHFGQGASLKPLCTDGGGQQCPLGWGKNGDNAYMPKCLPQRPNLWWCIGGDAGVWDNASIKDMYSSDSSPVNEAHKAGYNGICLDLEHGLISGSELNNLCAYIKKLGMTSVIVTNGLGPADPNGNDWSAVSSSNLDYIMLMLYRGGGDSSTYDDFTKKNVESYCDSIISGTAAAGGKNFKPPKLPSSKIILCWSFSGTTDKDGSSAKDLQNYFLSGKASGGVTYWCQSWASTPYSGSGQCPGKDSGFKPSATTC